MHRYWWQDERVGRISPTTIRGIQDQNQWLHYFELTLLEGEPKNCVEGMLLGGFDGSKLRKTEGDAQGRRWYTRWNMACKVGNSTNIHLGHNFVVFGPN